MLHLQTQLFANATFVVAAAAAVSSNAAQEQWQLMSRHGECSDLSSLKRVFPDMGAIFTPEEFIAFVKRKGLKVTTRDLEVPVGRLRAIEVPERELAMWFADRSLCSSTTIKP